MKIIIFALACVVASALAYSAAEPTGDVECFACEFLVGKVEGYLASNATVSEIEAELSKVCAALPGSISGICSDLVDNYLPEIIEALENKEDPDAVCTEIGLCSSSAVAVPAVAEPEGIECYLCTIIVTEVYNLINQNATEAQIIAEVDKLCAKLPHSDQATCTSIVQEYLPEIIKMLENNYYTPSTVCTELELCSSAPARKVAAPARKVAAPQDECAICELIVTELETLLANNATESEIESALDKVCSVLPGSFGATCESLISNYLPALIAELENGFPANIVCQKVGICTSVAAPQDECSTCTIVVSEIYSLLANNATETEIISALTAACSLLPSADQAVCTNLVQNYIPQIISMVEQDFTPTEICTEIGLCSSAPARKVAAPQDECAICELIVSELETLLANNATESEIEAALDKVCSVLPGSFGATCESLVNNYLPELIEELENGFPANIVCQKVGVCTSVASVAAPQESCATCQIIVNAIEEFIASNRSETFIIAELEKICAVLPGSFAGTCDSLVEQDVPSIIAAVEAKETPEVICADLGKCSSARRARVAAPLNSCATCSIVVNAVEEFVASNKTESLIIKELEKICAVLPGSYAGVCDSLVEQDVPSIIAAVEAKETPEVICTDLGKCSSAPVVVAKPAESAEVCEVCELVVTLAEKFAGNKTINNSEIIDDLKDICADIPAITTECDLVVTLFGMEILDAIEKGGAPETICSEIHLCTSSAPIRMTRLTRKLE